jgi:hypothetical protein
MGTAQRRGTWQNTAETGCLLLWTRFLVTSTQPGFIQKDGRQQRSLRVSVAARHASIEPYPVVSCQESAVDASPRHGLTTACRSPTVVPADDMVIMCRLSRKIAQRSQKTWCNATINATIGYCTRRSTGRLWTDLRLNLMHSHDLRPRQRGGVTGPAIERRWKRTCDES